MLNAVKIATLKVFGDRHSDVEKKVGEKVFKICNSKVYDKTKKLSCDVDWVDNPESSSFCALITVYYLYDDNEVIEHHCSICRETHDLFYCNRQYNCNQCEFKAYRYREEEKHKAMRSAGRYVLNSEINRK